MNQNKTTWTETQSQEWLKTHPWLAGCNFLPSSAVNSTEMWAADTFDPATIGRELGWAQTLGLGGVRVFLPWIVWQSDRTGFASRFGKFLDIAEHHALLVVPVLFDDCAFSGRQPYLGPQDQPRPGLHNSGWTPSPGHTNADDPDLHGCFEEYVSELVGQWGQDRRIWFWDLYNEPGNAGRGGKSIPLLEDVFCWARAAKPSQPLTAAPWEGPPDTPLNRVMLDNSDIITFHFYGDLESTQARVRELHQTAAQRPIICTEWMARTLGSRFETHLEYFRKAGIPCFHWGLVAGRTQTCLPWESREGDPPPEVWFHDIFDQDGKPHDPAEVELIRSQCRPV